MKKLPLKLIRLYQKTSKLQKPINQALFHTDKICRFEPSCSEYTYQAIEKYGTVKGTLLGLKRIARCNPLSRGGHDPLT
ncbi:MAG: membrane protein insertion efficiency factor YidD [Candidatus Levybacteria bacterium CG_4_10_14_0_2_um_filter_36_16]|nr:MAG: membrane protein insertion efficiency factor YidD [Candidatus Levybacteria bacterium CG2_30_37_29]PIZ97048.1 MAG: membrane protein insertion efficiency factor YidD [Candidatus Levybacteria bacterium CG_4_10_14_0_2_um_filter_36_16]